MCRTDVHSADTTVPRSQTGDEPARRGTADVLPISKCSTDQWMFYRSVSSIVCVLHFLADTPTCAHVVPVLTCPGPDVLQIRLTASLAARRFATSTSRHLFCVLDPERKLLVQFVRMLQVQIDPVLVAAYTEFYGFSLAVFDDGAVDIIDHLDECLARHVRTSNSEGNMLIMAFLPLNTAEYKRILKSTVGFQESSVSNRSVLEPESIGKAVQVNGFQRINSSSTVHCESKAQTTCPTTRHTVAAPINCANITSFVRDRRRPTTYIADAMSSNQSVGVTCVFTRGA